MQHRFTGARCESVHDLFGGDVSNAIVLKSVPLVISIIVSSLQVPRET